MNIRRFVAPNSRAALREVREVLGGDAVIISNRPTPEGVEILAAAAGELARIAETNRVQTAKPVARATERAPAPPSRTPAPAPVAAPRARTASQASPNPVPEWLTEAQVVRTRKRIATLLENSGEFDSSELNDDGMFSGENDAGVVSNLSSQHEPVRALAPEPVARPAAMPSPQPTALAPRSPTTTASTRPASPAPAAPAVVAASRASQVSPVLASPASSVAPRPAPDGLVDEMRSMRGFIEEQLANFAWSDNVRRQPGRMKLMQDLLCAGFSPSLSRQLQQNLPDDFSHAQGREWASEVLERNLPCGTIQDDLIDQGGVFALVGPTGVGKTTTAAKLAARFALKHGVDQLALITTDAYRIGAQDQLRIYGKILGIPVQTIHDQASLSSALQYLSKKKLVLIDTAGLGQRDERVAEQIALLRSTQAKRLLVLNATVQGETLEEIVNAYADRQFNGCVLTKIDEAVRLGAVLDVVIRHRLKIQYVSNGQRVPEDLHHPNPKYLIHRSLRETPGPKAFEITTEDHPAWLAAIAHSAREISAKGSRHV